MDIVNQTLGSSTMGAVGSNLLVVGLAAAGAIGGAAFAPRRWFAYSTLVEKIASAQNANELRATLTVFEIADYSLKLEQAILNEYRSTTRKHQLLSYATLGLASFVNPPLADDELVKRIGTYRDLWSEMEQTARVIQRLRAVKVYAKKRRVAREVSKHQVPQFNSAFKTAKSVGKLWLKKGPNLTDGVRGQVIWDKTKTLYKELTQHGYYVFLHAHSYPITLHLELASHFQSMHQSIEFKLRKPEQSRRKFRAPGVARHFQNTTEYLKSDLGRAINSGSTIDDKHRESIISCDVIPDNEEAFESTKHFFMTNRSIVDTNSSTGMAYAEFDQMFISSFLRNAHLRTYAVHLFAEARQELQGVADYGMIRVIAIAKETLESERTNYVWRSHAYGVICPCKHVPGVYGHREFVETLRRNQMGEYKHCNGGIGRSVPQYRILAANLDRDPTKQVYTMDCLNDKEKAKYAAIYGKLKWQLSHLVRLEQAANSKDVAEMAAILVEIKIEENSVYYRRGAAEVLKQSGEILQRYLSELARLLPKDTYSFVTRSIQ